MAFLAGLFLGLCLLLFADTAATQSLGEVLPIRWSIPIHPLYFCQNLEWGAGVDPGWIQDFPKGGGANDGKGKWGVPPPTQS